MFCRRTSQKLLMDLVSTLVFGQRRLPPALPPPTGCRSPHRSSTGDLAAHPDARGRVAAHVHVIDPVGLEIGRVRNDQNGLAFSAVAHVDLLRDAFQDGRQSFVDRVQRNQPLDTRVHVDILLGVARQGEQQFLYRHFVDHHAVGGNLDLRLGRGHEIRCAVTGGRIFSFAGLWRELFGVDVALRGRHGRLVGCSRPRQGDEDRASVEKHRSAACDGSRHHGCRRTRVADARNVLLPLNDPFSTFEKVSRVF